MQQGCLARMSMIHVIHALHTLKIVLQKTYFFRECVPCYLNPRLHFKHNWFPDLCSQLFSSSEKALQRTVQPLTMWKRAAERPNQNHFVTTYQHLHLQTLRLIVKTLLITSVFNPNFLLVNGKHLITINKAERVKESVAH